MSPPAHAASAGSGSSGARRRAPYVAEALVVRTIPFAETSQVVHLATERYGLVAALAKGARRPSGAHEGGLALGAIGEAQLSPRRGAELELLRRFRRLARLRGLARDLDRYYGTCYVLDLLRSWMRPGLAAPVLYRSGVAALEGLVEGTPDTQAFWIVFFEARAIASAGQQPVLEGCAACGRKGRAGPFFSPAAGGVVDADCDAGTGPRRRLSALALRALERLYATPLPALVAEPPSPREISEIRAVHDLLVPYLLERRPTALPLISRPRG